MALIQFIQLPTVHGVVLGYTMSLIYALKMKKQEDAYIHTYIHIYMKVLTFAWKRNLNINLSLCMMDFKVANMNAIQLFLPNAQVKGYLFHFS